MLAYADRLDRVILVVEEDGDGNKRSGDFEEGPAKRSKN